MPPRGRFGASRAGRRGAAASGRAFEKALEAGLSIGVGFVLGYYIDVWLGTGPVFLLVFAIAGFVACVRVLMSIQWAPEADTPAEDAGQPDQAKPAGGGIDPRRGDG